jgi:hypothetical protein
MEVVIGHLILPVHSISFAYIVLRHNESAPYYFETSVEDNTAVTRIALLPLGKQLCHVHDSLSYHHQVYL